MMNDETPERPSFSYLARQLGRSVLVTVCIVAPIGLIASLFYAQALNVTVASALGGQTEYIKEVGAEYDAFYDRVMESRKLMNDVAKQTDYASQLMALQVPNPDAKTIDPTEEPQLPPKDDVKPDPDITGSKTLTVAERDRNVLDRLSNITEYSQTAIYLLGFPLPRFKDQFGSFSFSPFSPAYAASNTSRRDMTDISVFFRLGIFLFLLAVLTGVLFLFLLQYFRTDNAEKRRFADKMINTIVGFMIGMTTGIAGGSLL